MRVKNIQLKNFRCFPSLTLQLDGSIILIEGSNGSGKTSLLEALHYLCYMRSFRTHIPRELVNFEQQAFFIKASIVHDDELEHTVQVGFSGNKRLVKLNQQAVQSFKDLMTYYRVVTLIEDDLMLIKGGPDIRRAFIDQALILLDPDYLTLLRNLKSTLDNRNALLNKELTSQDSYDFWTKQLFEQSRELQIRRCKTLKSMEDHTNALLSKYFNQKEETIIRIDYRTKKKIDKISFKSFIKDVKDLQDNEVRFRRSLFGAHLDDYIIHFRGKHSKNYASRGQQKLVMLLLKISHVQQIIEQHGQVVFLLDDLMADFDEKTLEKVLHVLTALGCQLIFTLPTQTTHLKDILLAKKAHLLQLTDRKVN